MSARRHSHRTGISWSVPGRSPASPCTTWKPWRGRVECPCPWLASVSLHSPRMVVASRRPTPMVGSSSGTYPRGARWRLRPRWHHDPRLRPDGRSLASGALDRLSTIILWDLETGRPGRRLRTEETGGPVVALALSRDGTLLASASGYERSVRVWDPAAGRLIGSIAGHARGTIAIAFAPDGTTLATAGNDGAVRLWEVSTGRQQAALDGRASVLCGVAFSPDGRRLVATSRDDHHLRLWEPTDIEPRPRPTVGRR